TLELGGTTSNIGGGTLYVNDGTLALNKSGTAVAVPNALVVGDNDGGISGGVAADQVVYRDTAGTDQIANGSAVTINRSAQVTYGTRNDTIGVVDIDLGRLVGTTGNLTIARA